jgi:hypothetical protein
MKNRCCFSRSGWWQTLCGLDAANQGFGWTSRAADVGCPECRVEIARGEHRRWKTRHILKKMRWERERKT